MVIVPENMKYFRCGQNLSPPMMTFGTRPILFNTLPGLTCFRLSTICTLIQHRFEKLSKALPIGAMDSKYKRMIATFKGEMERIAR